MLTCGMIFFSTASWNNGGGGRSTARNRNGDAEALISVGQFVMCACLRIVATLTSINVKPGFLAPS